MRIINKSFLKTLVRLKRRRDRDIPVPLERFDPSEVERILVVSSTAIGDALFAVPGIRALRELMPRARLDLLLRDKVADLFSDFPLADEIISYRGRYKNGITLLRKLKKKKYHLCIVFHDSDPCPIEAAFAAGIPFIFRIGQKDQKVRHLLSARIPYDEKKHAIDQRLEVIRRVFNVSLSGESCLRMDLPVHEKKVANFRKSLLGSSMRKGKETVNGVLVGFQFSASGKYKEWPVENFIDLGARLLDLKDSCNIVLIGGPGDAARAEKIKDDIEKKGGKGRVFNLSGKVVLKDLPAAIKALDVLVTNDTGPLHVAIAVGTKTVSLFVPTNVEGTGPVQDLHLHKVISKPKPCNPCVEKYCKRPDCMGLIKTSEVERAVTEALKFS